MIRTQSTRWWRGKTPLMSNHNNNHKKKNILSFLYPCLKILFIFKWYFCLQLNTFNYILITENITIITLQAPEGAIIINKHWERAYKKKNVGQIPNALLLNLKCTRYPSVHTLFYVHYTMRVCSVYLVVWEWAVVTGVVSLVC